MIDGSMTTVTAMKSIVDCGIAMHCSDCRVDCSEPHEFKIKNAGYVFKGPQTDLTTLTIISKLLLMTVDLDLDF